MGPIDAFKTGLRKSFVFSGRASRSEFWFFYIIYSSITSIVMMMVFAPLDPEPDDTAFWVFAVASVLVSVPCLSVLVRRLHDTNISGWWFAGILGYFFVVNRFISDKGFALLGPTVLILNVPAVVATLWLEIMIFFWPGTAGPNRYGPDPRAINAPD